MPPKSRIAKPVLLARENKDPNSALFVEGGVEYESFPSLNTASGAVGMWPATLSLLLAETGAYFDEQNKIFFKYKDLSSFPAVPAPSPSVRIKWTSKEYRVVRDVCGLLGPGRWDDVARVLNGRTADEIQMRWEVVLSGRGAGAETAQAAAAPEAPAASARAQLKAPPPPNDKDGDEDGVELVLEPKTYIIECDEEVETRVRLTGVGGGALLSAASAAGARPLAATPRGLGTAVAAAAATAARAATAAAAGSSSLGDPMWGRDPSLAVRRGVDPPGSRLSRSGERVRSGRRRFASVRPPRSRDSFFSVFFLLRVPLSC
jgi:pyruvate/2-oxoglutarate dehydrogenase complex dihydrolipoamide acyltransferase (E2) component